MTNVQGSLESKHHHCQWQLEENPLQNQYLKLKNSNQEHLIIGLKEIKKEVLMTASWETTYK